MKHRQASAGFALLALIAAIAMISAGFLLDRLDAAAVARHKADVTTEALRQAKDAIVGWSVLQGTPGKLPCPEDTSLIGAANEGQAASNCTLPAVGRLAWRTLGIGPIKDGEGEPLWYAVSPGFRSTVINSSTPAGLVMDMAAVAVAIVFAPGKPLAMQSRGPFSAASPPLAANYLEYASSGGAPSFISVGPQEYFNDRQMVIRHPDLFNTVVKRVVREVRGDAQNGLVRYYQIHNDLPPTSNGATLYGTADMDYPGSSWLNSKGWFGLLQYYRINATTARLDLYGTSTVVSVP